MGELFGRLIAGTLWGVGAGLVMTFGKEGAPGLRAAAKTAMRGFIAASERVGEARESFDDLVAESKTESRSPSRATPRSIPVERDTPPASSPNGRGNGARRTASKPRATKRA
jgi:hypothetical protein